MSDPAPIPLLDLTAQNAELLPEVREAFERVFAKNAFILGQEVEFFEREVAAYVGAKHAVTSGPYPGKAWDDDQSAEA